MQTIVKKLSLTSLLIAALLLFSPLSITHAQSVEDVCRGVSAAGASCADGGTSVNKIIEVVVNVLSALVGIVAVIMIIIGGFKYITSSGDSGNVKSAKDTIIYAIVGLVIVAMAQIIVRFVLNRVA